MLKLLIDYANNNNIILELNEKDKNGNYPLLLVCVSNSAEMVELLIDYSNKNNIILELNQKNERGNYPLLWTCNHNNTEMLKLLIIYANKNNIVLKYQESEYENNSKIKYKTIEILKNYKKDKGFLLPTLVVAINDFSAQEHYQLSIKKDEFLIVTIWNCENKGWVYGHRIDNKEKKRNVSKSFY